MDLILFLNIFFIFLILFSSLLLILSKNPIYSVLLLILIFFSSSSLLILFNIDFLGLLLLIIYVGAIAVLFLFVVMMLDIKYNSFNKKDYLFFLILLFLSPFFFNLIYNSFFLSFFNKAIKNSELLFFYFDSFSNIDIFGQCLYNYYIPIFLISGLVLLVAMLGAIILTLKFNLQKRNEFIHKKLSRTSIFLSFFN